MGIGVANQIIVNGDERIELARDLIEQLEAGDEAEINQTIDKLINIRESQLFQQVGKLTRELHNSIGDCIDSDNLSSIANDDMVNAKERLNYVIEKTEESANRTINAIESTMPISEELQNEAQKMSDEWEKFKRRELTADDFRDLTKRITSFLESVTHHSNSIHENITDILMAQEYQDLTGQTIKQVIEIVERVEGSLIELIKCQGLGDCEITDSEGKDIKAEGPQIDSTKSNVVASQDDVDDLLSSLGF